MDETIRNGEKRSSLPRHTAIPRCFERLVRKFTGRGSTLFHEGGRLTVKIAVEQFVTAVQCGETS